MKIQLTNLGVLRQAEFELGELTVICGRNNTGKTYATYALYGFLSYWREAFRLPVPEAKITQLLEHGVVEFDTIEIRRNSPEIVAQGCADFTKHLSQVFAAAERDFANSEFALEIDDREILPVAEYERIMGAARAELFAITKTAQQPTVIVSLLVGKDKVKIPHDVIGQIIGDALKEIVFGQVFPSPFIASAERTGAAIFRSELNFARNRLIEEITAKNKDIDPLSLLTRVYSDYALPVKRDVDFIRRLEEISKQESDISKTHPHILKEFEGIVGGEYKVTKNDELFYVPAGQRVSLTMDASSSSVRSLLDVGFYLRHVAQAGDLLIIDEPELNLHPENQRRVVRLLAKLVNLGIKVFVTTHSDYLIKELNTLIMLNQDKPHLKRIAEEEGYNRSELICIDQVRVYIAEVANTLIRGNKRKSKCPTLVRAKIDQEYGVDVTSFDNAIDEMNRIQDAITWGE